MFDWGVEFPEAIAIDLRHSNGLRMSGISHRWSFWVLFPGVSVSASPATPKSLGRKGVTKSFEWVLAFHVGHRWRAA